MVCEAWLDGREYGLLCGSLGSETAGRDVVFHVLENQCLKKKSKTKVSATRAAVVKTTHSRLFRYRDNYVYECVLA